MVEIGLMIESQFGLNWPRWQRLLKATEDFGYKYIFLSDHFTIGPPDQDSLDAWVALTYAASHTSRIEIGPMVSPITFRHPSIIAYMAAAVDELSNGRLVFGMGAGWHEREHRQFGIPFYDFPTRFAMLEEALEVVTRLFNGDEPVSFEGEYFSLNRAILLPRPTRPGGPPILIGGSGPKRTLPLAAKYAVEWNGVYINADTYRDRTTRLDRLLEKNGRKPGDVKRSLMHRTIFGKDDAILQANLDGQDADKLRAQGMLVGTPAMLIDQINQYVEVGVQRFMLQWLNLDDIDGLEGIAKEILPHFHSN
jgi:F420-dependent oxidoreductase-like protein